MEYGFDFTKDICYISTYDSREAKPQIQDLDPEVVSENLEERIGLIKEYLKNKEDRAVAVVETMTKEILEHDDPNIIFLSKEEAFAAFVLDQDAVISRRDTCVFEFHDGWFRTYKFRQLGKFCMVTKHSVSDVHEFSSEKEKDKFFTKHAAEQINHGNISTIYLVGEEFEGEWMKLSLPSVCSGRRVFMGNSLFSNGGILWLQKKELAGRILTDEYHLYYWGIRAFHHGQKDVFIPIIQPGEFWFATGGEIMILADECDKLEIEGVHSITRKKLKITLPIHMKQENPVRTTKLNIQMKCISSDVLEVVVYDAGFGVSREAKGILYQEEFKLPS